VGLVRLDSMEIHGFGEKLGHRYICSGGRHRFASAVECLAAMRAEGRTDFLGVVRQFLSSYSQRGLLIVISDFLDEGGCEKPLQYLADFGHELMLIQLWSEEDRNPPWDGELDLLDAESGERLKLDVDADARQQYTRAFDAYSQSLLQLAARSSGRYVGVSTAQSLEEVIFGPLARARGVA
jgi:uncharacterized protein (DUF58 family)